MTTSPTRTRSPQAPSRRRRAPLGWHRGLALAALALSVACNGAGSETPAAPEPTAAAAPAYPEGTAFAFDGIPIAKAEIDRYVPLVRLIDPHIVESSMRRKAFTNVVLPVIAGSSLMPEEREAAFQVAQAELSAARETGTPPANVTHANYLTGTWRDVGMVTFNEALSLDVGSYSNLVESPGGWTFFKLIASNADGQPMTGLTQITIQRYDFPYLPVEVNQELIQSAIDALPIEIIDEEWEHIIPPALLYKTGPASGDTTSPAR